MDDINQKYKQRMEGSGSGSTTSTVRQGRSVCLVQIVVDVTGSMENGIPSRMHVVNLLLKDFFKSMFCETKRRNALRIGLICVAHDVILETKFSSWGDFKKGELNDAQFREAYPKKKFDMKQDHLKDDYDVVQSYFYPSFEIVDEAYDEKGTQIYKGIDLAINKIQNEVQRRISSGGDVYPSHIILFSDGNADSHNNEISKEDREVASKLREYRDISLKEKTAIIPTIIGIGKEDDLNMDVIRLYSKEENDYIHIRDGADMDRLSIVVKMMANTIIKSIAATQYRIDQSERS